MSYSACDFMDSIMDALDITPERIEEQIKWHHATDADPSMCADLCLDAIQNLKNRLAVAEARVAAARNIGGQPTRWFGNTLFVALPPALHRPIDVCHCAYCEAHKDKPPMWDTLALGTEPDCTWTVHYPELQT